MIDDHLVDYLARETALIRDIPRPERDETCQRAEEALRRLAELLKQGEIGAFPADEN
jgi:hypothetical protein